MESSPKTEIAENIKQLTHIIDYFKNVGWVLSIGLALIAFTLIKWYCFDVVRVNNHDMDATYEYGDAVLIKKMFNSYSANDVVYFEFPQDDSVMTRTLLFQRIVAEPGDTFTLIEKSAYRNEMLLPEELSIQHNYFINTKLVMDSAFKIRHQLVEGGKISDKHDYSFSLSQTQYEQLLKDTLVNSLELKSEKNKVNDQACFPSCKHYSWNLDHYGPIYIPKLNDTLTIDTINLHLYSAIIHDYEKNDLVVRNDSILINGVLSQKYIVKKDYYFVLGDNRDNAIDSRSWGFLPKSKIKGKAIYTLRSVK